MRTFLFAVLLIFSHSASAQKFRYGLGYNYTYAPRWDKAIQTYNFSRPELTEKQPLLMHGYYAGATLLLSELLHTQGITLTYNYARSTAQNENFRSVLSLHMVSCGYVWHYEKTERPDHFYWEGGCSVLLGGIFRKVNDEPIADDDKNVKAFGIGGEISAGCGYHILLTQKLALAPFVQFGYSPYYFSPASESILNQTISLTGKKWTGIVTARIGINIHFVKFELRT